MVFVGSNVSIWSFSELKIFFREENFSNSFFEAVGPIPGKDSSMYCFCSLGVSGIFVLLSCVCFCWPLAIWIKICEVCFSESV